MAEGEYLQIGEVAALTGLTQRTLRYYEELQLLDPPTRMTAAQPTIQPSGIQSHRRKVRGSPSATKTRH